MQWLKVNVKLNVKIKLKCKIVWFTVSWTTVKGMVLK